jgi:hypothetical protein
VVVGLAGIGEAGATGAGGVAVKQRTVAGSYWSDVLLGGVFDHR